MNGLRRVAARCAAASVTTLAAGSLAVLPPPSTTSVLAYNGGASVAAPAAQPCAPPCSFVGDNTGTGLTGFDTPGRTNPNATWWAFIPTESKTYTFRVNSIAPAGWDNTLIVTDASANLLAYSDDAYGFDAMTSVLLTAGLPYRFALASYKSSEKGTATISISGSVPNVPSGVSAVAGDRSATVSWTAPFDNFAAITEYRVYADGGATFTSVTGAPPATGVTIGGLAIGTPHSFQVSAINSNGESARSTASNTVSPSGPTTTSVSFSPTSPAWPASFDVVASVGSSVTVTAGSVTFYRDGVDVGTVAVVDGAATLSQSLAPGMHGFMANYGGTAYFYGSSGSNTVTIGRASQTIAFAAPADRPFSSGSFTVTPSSPSGLGVTVASVTNTVCTVAGATVTLVTGGTCTLIASQSGDPWWAAATDVAHSFDVTDAPQTVVLDPLADHVWSTDTIDVSATSSSGLPVALVSTTPTVCTVDEDEITMLRAGTCDITAAQPGDAHFDAADPVSRSFQVAPAAQDALAAHADSYALAIGDTTDLYVTGGSGDGAITYAVTSGPTHCSVTGNVLTAIDRGSCAVTATKAADDRHDAATAVSTDVVVSRATPSVDVTGPTSAAPGEHVTVQVEVTGLIEGRAPAQVSLHLDGASTDASFAPASMPLTLGPDGRSGTAAFSVIVGPVGTLVVDATLVANPTYNTVSDPVPHDITVATRIPTVQVDGDHAVVTGQAAHVTVSVTGLAPGAAPGTLTLDLVGAAGSTAVPATGTLTIADDGRSGTATFTVTAGAEGSLSVGATLAAAAAYVASTSTEPLVITVGPVPPVLMPVAPTRVFDTRPGTIDLRVVPDTKLAAGTVLDVQFTDLLGLVPASGVAAVSLHLTVVEPEGTGFLTAYPCGERPVASTLSYRTGQVVGNTAIVPVDPATGHVCLFSNRTTHVVADLDGWIPSNAGYHAVRPTRIVDTRPGMDGLRAVADGPLPAYGILAVQFTDLADLVPETGVGAVVVNLTVVSPEAGGFATAYACGTRPDAASINFVAGRNVANTVVVPVDPVHGAVCFVTNRRAHLVVDLDGWFAAGLGFVPIGPARVLDTRPEYHDTGLLPVESTKVGGGNVLTVRFTGLGGVVPTDGVGAVALNVTVVDTAGNGFLTVYPCGERPMVSSLNYPTGGTVASSVIVPVDPASGTGCFFSSRPTHLVVDLDGWFVAARR